MKFTASLLVACLWLFNFFSAANAENVKTTGIPDWVEPVEIPDLSSLEDDQHRNGLVWLLDDTQFNWDGRTQTTFYRSVVKVINRQGLEQAATLESEFDPEIEDFALHSVRIIRDGEVLDLTDEVELNVLRREEDLGDNILDGHLTVHADIKGVRVGDIVEIAKSWIEARPVFESRLGVSTRVTYTIPVAAAEIRLRVPQGHEVRYKTHGKERQPEKLSRGSHDIYVWKERDLAPVPSEKSRPHEFPLFDYLEISGWEDWNTVRDALLDSYRVQETLPLSIRAQVDKIRETYQSPAMRMSKALQFIQDEIRYVGIEIGAGGYVPRQPSLVVERGFGDCKDKSLLLTAVLRELGIEAAVALVNTDRGYGLPDRLPSPFRFNHAIVRAEIEGESFWLDPTWTHSGGQGKNIVQPSYGHALVLDAAIDGLVPMPRFQPSGPEVKVTEDYWFPSQPGGEIRFEVKSVFKDREADYMRRTLARNGKAEMARRYASYYSERYPGMIPSNEPRFVDNLETNEVRIYESYRLDMKAFAESELVSDFQIQGDAVLGKLPTPRGYQRRSPVALNGPITYEHSIYMNNQVRGFAKLEDISIDNEAFSYRRTTPREGKMLWIRWQLDIKQRTIAADLVGDYLKDERRAEDESYLTYDLTRYFSLLNEEKDASLLQEAGGPVDPEIEDQMALVFLGLLLASFLAYLIFALRHGLNADRNYRNAAYFFPVSVFKFLALSTVTVGIYPLFWSLKFWIWVRRNEQAGIWPAWRALFSFVWMFSAFRRANHCLAEKGKNTLPIWLAATAAAFYVILQFSGFLLNSQTLPYSDLAVFVLLPLLQGVCFLPAVLAVNRCNLLMHVEYNSEWSLWNVSAVLIFALLLALNVLGHSLPHLSS